MMTIIPRKSASWFGTRQFNNISSCWLNAIVKFQDPASPQGKSDWLVPLRIALGNSSHSHSSEETWNRWVESSVNALCLSTNTDVLESTSGVIRLSSSHCINSSLPWKDFRHKRNILGSIHLTICMQAITSPSPSYPDPADSIKNPKKVTTNGNAGLI
jgi:hypothetical protein